MAAAHVLKPRLRGGQMGAKARSYCASPKAARPFGGRLAGIFHDLRNLGAGPGILGDPRGQALDRAGPVVARSRASM